MAEEHRTQVLYESPHRLLKLLSELCVYLVPERRVAVVREISKMFEEVRRGSPAELEAYFQQKGVKGEIAVVIEALDLKALKRAGRAIENTEEET
jgi:16S rRNA (cytidine1402-2'-O)-methyltransferase